MGARIESAETGNPRVLLLADGKLRRPLTLMKTAGFLLLPAGWILVLSALILLPGGNARSAFLFSGIMVELLGLVLAVRSHRVPRKDRE